MKVFGRADVSSVVSGQRGSRDRGCGCAETERCGPKGDGIITNGRGKILPYQTMSVDQLKDMVAFKLTQEVNAVVGFWHGARGFLHGSCKGTNKGGNNEEVFISNRNRRNFVSGRVHFARSRRCEREKIFKAKCVGCHGANGEGKPAMKSPSIKGKSADEITNAFSTSPKHSSVKSLTPAQVKDLAAYLATLK